jgi:hypothetical protein
MKCKQATLQAWRTSTGPVQKHSCNTSNIIQNREQISITNVRSNANKVKTWAQVVSEPRQLIQQSLSLNNNEKTNTTWGHQMSKKRRYLSNRFAKY